ncbi:hypothetical protein I4U23_001381 [Adineta vaga]|nr:hypothetical protein I4U23_001381 [Adineta vaga]
MANKENDPMLSSQQTNLDKKNTPVTAHGHSNNISILMNIFTILCSIIFGLVFGFLINKGTVFVAPTIRKQMLFQRFAMLKMFLAAVGMSMLSVALLELFRKVLYGKIINGYIEHNSRRNFVHYIVGGSLIGLGMVICGSCPGTVYIQVGSGIVNSLFTCLGGLLGTYFYYGIIHERVSTEKLPSTSFVLRRISDLLHTPSIIVHLILGLLFLGAAIGLEFLVPWRSDLDYYFQIRSNLNPQRMIGSVFRMAAWPPSLCGAGVGLLQFFFILCLEKSLGASSAFSVLAAQLCRIKIIGQKIPSLVGLTYGLKNYTALLFALAAVGGSALSSILSDTLPLGPENGTNILSSILGGFLLLVGARCAGGCTSGQGISGTTHLLVGSFLTTACIFGSGIIFAFSFSLKYITVEIVIKMENDSMLPAEQKKLGETSKTKMVEHPVSTQGQSKNKNMVKIIRTVLSVIILGVLFGFLMNKATVFLTPTIRKQMVFQRFVMLKMFLAAVGVSMLSVAILELVRKSLYGKVLVDDIEYNCRRGIIHYIAGGSLIGLGMVICGSCPGTIFVQVGSGIFNSLFTCLGALLGTFFYYIVIHDRITKERLPSTSPVFRRLSDILHTPSVVLHSIFGLVFLGAAIGLEFFVPWRSDLDYYFRDRSFMNPDSMIGSVFRMAAWPPSLCGAGVGLLQLFFILLLEMTLGASSAFSVLAAQVCRIKSIGRALPSLSSLSSGLENYTIFLFGVAAIGGSALSSTLSHTIPLGPENGTNVLASVLGGFLLFIGARCAGGCTSGQGISGTTHLLLGSLLTTACIFGSGIVFGYCILWSKTEWFF